MPSGLERLIGLVFVVDEEHSQPQVVKSIYHNPMWISFHMKKAQFQTFSPLDDISTIKSLRPSDA